MLRKKFSSTVLFFLLYAFLNSALGNDEYSPGNEFQDCELCPIMVVIPAGSFSMGGPPVDQGRPYAEGELRLVNIPHHFAAGKFEITYEQWELCVSEERCPAIKRDDWSTGQHPLANVSWKEASEYTKWLTKKTGRPYRLLTEAEWEYLATGGISRARFYGLNLVDICHFGNVYDQTAEMTLEYGLESIPCDDHFDFSAPVGSLKPNQFGVYDTLGNVWEWTEDCQAILWRSGPTDASARIDGHCSQRAYRGSSWLSHPPKYLQIPDRYKYMGAREIDLGFRVGVSLNLN